MKENNKKLKSVSLARVKLDKGLLGEKNKLIRDKVIPYQWKALNDEIDGAAPSHAIENFKIAAGEAEGEFVGMVFQDSDVAKWLEAVAYKLSTHPDSELEELADQVIELIGKAQQPDGYLNTYYTLVEPENRWTNLAECHELYCAGHMMEAAVAYYQATGKTKLLNIMSRFADLIDAKFGTEPGKIKGYPGHQEIELALIKLYQVTNNENYLKLAKYFIDERGQKPYYFDLEWEERGMTTHWPNFRDMGQDYYHQAHQPVREQSKAVGHAVRAMYMYTGMTDIAVETGDQSLIEACKRLWKNTTTKQMYITGGIGSSGYGEAFTFDYDLPNDTAYTETCAAIGLVFWAQRMLHLELDREYADIMEKALYNGVLSGISADGERFFYVNPLEVWPEADEQRHDLEHVKHTRQQWFGCACCPPNLARLIASIGKYIYSHNDNEIYLHLYADSETKFKLNGKNITIKQETDYPWDEDIKIAINVDEPLDFTLGLRIPGWCNDARLKVNGERINLENVIKQGYAIINREWSNDDQVELHLSMPAERIKAHPQVRKDSGKVVVQRGPIVYCLEEVDNGANLADIKLPFNNKLTAEYNEELLGGVTVIKGEALRTDKDSWGDELYKPVRDSLITVPITFIPYFAWSNRKPGEMLVWVNER